MTREEQKAYNAENYPASVLTWLNAATDRAYDDFESRTCESCKYAEDSDDGYAYYCTKHNEYENGYMHCGKWEQK